MATNMQPALSSRCRDRLTLVGGLARGMTESCDGMVMLVFVSKFVRSLHFLNFIMALKASVHTAMTRRSSYCHFSFSESKNYKYTGKLSTL